MNKERLLNTFLDLVKIYSPSKNEINVMKYITEKLEKLGVKYILHDHSAEYGGNTPVIIAKLEKNCDDEKLNPISLSAHMDVVEPSKDLDVYVEDGLVKTRTKTTLGGDDKGGVAIILETFENLVENNLPHNDVFAVITPSEEIGLLGAKSIKWEEIPSEFMPAKDMLVLDNGGGSDLVAVEGPCMYKINVHYEGASAHAGIEPEKGRSAIIAMSSAISKMKIGRLNDHTTSNIGSIVSEFPTNVVPKDCKIRMEVRCLNEDEAKENVDNYIDIYDEVANFNRKLAFNLFIYNIPVEVIFKNDAYSIILKLSEYEFLTLESAVSEQDSRFFNDFNAINSSLTPLGKRFLIKTLLEGTNHHD